MVKCVNPQCENNGHELEVDSETCPLCGGKTEKSVASTRTTIAVVSVILSIAAVIFVG